MDDMTQIYKNFFHEITDKVDEYIEDSLDKRINKQAKTMRVFPNRLRRALIPVNSKYSFMAERNQKISKIGYEAAVLHMRLNYGLKERDILYSRHNHYHFEIEIKNKEIKLFFLTNLHRCNTS